MQDVHKIQTLLCREVLKENLAKAGLFIVAYETLKNSIIDKPKAFFTLGGMVSDDDYKKEVLSRDKDRLKASCDWFRDNGAISEDDVSEFLSIRAHRNELAHELPNVLLNPEVQVAENRLTILFELLCKVDRWRLTEVIIPTNPEFDGQTVDPREARSLAMEFVSHLISVVYGTNRTQDSNGEQPQAPLQ